MKKSITISIAEPCQENWQEMTPTEKGKFCDVCTKEVIDFTKTSDEELVKKVTSGVSLCGRFKKSQLDREVKLERKSSHSFMNYAASLLMPLSLLSTSIISAETDTSFKKPYTSIGIGSLNKDNDKARVIVTGKVTDIHGTSLNQTQIQIKDTDKTFEVESDGSFTLKCVSDDVLIFSAKGFESQEFNIGRNLQLNLPVVLNYERLKAHPTLLGKMAVSETLESKVAICGVKPMVLPIEEIEIQGDIGFTEEVTEQEIIEETVTKEIKEKANNIIISGTILDESNLPLIGVNVIVKGTTNGTQTDFDGYYHIAVKPNQTLVFSYSSYETKEVTLSNISNDISFKMEPDLETLGGIIVIAGTFDYHETSGSPYNPSPFYNSKKAIEKRKQAYKNTIAFEKIKAERKKEARKKARAAKKKK